MKPKRKPSLKVIETKTGLKFQASSLEDIQAFPQVMPKLSGSKLEIHEKIIAKRERLFDSLRGSGSHHYKFARPGFLRSEKNSRVLGYYNPNKSPIIGKPMRIKSDGKWIQSFNRYSDRFVYFPVFEITFLTAKEFADNQKTVRRKPKRIGDYKTPKNFPAFYKAAEFDESIIVRTDTMRRYFLSASVGSRVALSPRPLINSRQAVRIDGRPMTEIILKHFTYKKSGIPNKLMKIVIGYADARFNGYALVTGIIGVWRTAYSLESKERRGRLEDAIIRERNAAAFEKNRDTYKYVKHLTNVSNLLSELYPRG